jgi:site-specific recombinase XerD
MRSRKIGGHFERPPKSGVWWIDYRDGAGKRHREKIGRRGDARDEYDRRVKEISEGKFMPPRVAGRAFTFRDLAQLAMEQKKVRLRPQSYRTDMLRLGRILPMIGAVDVEQLSPEKLEKAFLDLRREGLSGSTVNRYRSMVSSIFTWACSIGRARLNPVQRVKRFKENEGRIRYMLPDEETRLREAIRRDCPDREAELDLALYTGMRRGEQFTLKWSDVDLDRTILTVRGKTGRRFVTVNSSAREAIEKLSRRQDRGARDASQFVCAETQRDDQVDWRRWFEHAIKEANIRNFRWHDLRHTFCSRLVMAGADLRSVQELAGHASIVTTMRYAHLSPEHKRAAAEKIGGQIK